MTYFGYHKPKNPLFYRYKETYEILHVYHNFNGIYLFFILASYFCRSDANNANIANIEFGVVPKSDSIYRIYAYDASQQDTLSTTNRISTCFKDGTVTDPDRDRVSFSIAIDFSAASGHDCGAYVVCKYMYFV